MKEIKVNYPEILFYEPFSRMYFAASRPTVEKILRDLFIETSLSNKNFFYVKDFLKKVCGADYPMDFYIPLQFFNDITYSVGMSSDKQPFMRIDWGDNTYSENCRVYSK